MEVPMPITPRVPHDDLVVGHDVHDTDTRLPSNRNGHPSSYRLRLLNPDRSEAAPDIVFHKGSPEKGWHGWTTQKAIEGLIAHMEYHQATLFACDQNERILAGLRMAHEACQARVTERKERGVLYDHKTP